MNKFLNLKPRKRSKLHIYFGKKYFILRKKFQNYKIHHQLASTKETVKDLPYEVFKHKTPIYRKLSGISMELQKNKADNLRIAIKKLNHITINPGEIFSYWHLIGKPQKRDGYKKGMILSYGKYITGYGGGLCQLSNLIYWMTLHSPLDVIERHRHSYDVFPDIKRTQPFGSGATCVYNYRDLQIQNNTDSIVQFVFSIENDFLCGKILSSKNPEYRYRVYEKNHTITHEHWGNYIRHNQIFREIIDEKGNIVNEEFICENHALMMYEPFLENGNDH